MYFRCIFSSNQIVHKILFSLYFLAPDLLFDILIQKHKTYIFTYQFSFSGAKCSALTCLRPDSEKKAWSILKWVWTIAILFSSLEDLKMLWIY